MVTAQPAGESDTSATDTGPSVDSRQQTADSRQQTDASLTDAATPQADPTDEEINAALERLTGRKITPRKEEGKGNDSGQTMMQRREGRVRQEAVDAELRVKPKMED